MLEEILLIENLNIIKKTLLSNLHAGSNSSPFFQTFPSMILFPLLPNTFAKTDFASTTNFYRPYSAAFKSIIYRFMAWITKILANCFTDLKSAGSINP